MTNSDIAHVLDEIGDLLDFQGANPFRTRAYRNAAARIRDLTESVVAIVADENRQLTEIEGVGKDLADKIRALVKTGSIPQHQELLAQVPTSVLALLRIPGLGPKKAAVLFNELKVTTLDQLRAACESQQVRKLKGFGAKTEETILAGLEIAAAADVRPLWAEADKVVQALLEHFKGCPGLERIAPAGSYRRGRETIGDLDLLADSRDYDAVMSRFAEYAGIATVLTRGETKMSVRLASGLQVDLRVVPAESFGAALQYFTGSKEHNVVLRGMAKAAGLKINEWGVFRDDKYLAGRTEEDVYAQLSLPCFPPEMRENRGEFQLAAAGKLPKLIEIGDVQGDLHMHTTETDGRATLPEMVAAARARGLKYIAITDHSQRVSMANGMNGERLLLQWAAIDQFNDSLKGFVVLKGVEVDILEKGGLDLPDEVLAQADWVVASVHYGQNQPREQITNRILGAIENEHVDAIAHPTGRLINRRKPYEVDLQAVIKAARDHGKLLELNANPMRLDLDDVACATAKEQGVPIVISTDAHSVDGLDCLRYGILQARRGGLTKADVANARPWKEMKTMLGART